MRLKILAAVAVLSSAPFLCHAQTQDVVVVTQASGPATSDLSSNSAGLPGKGMTKVSVARAFGDPARKHATVGGGSRQQPPITRWDYDGFSVFFEYDHVVDAVQRGNPAPIAVYDGLAGGPRR